MSSVANRSRRRLAPTEIKQRLRNLRREQAKKAATARRRLEQIHQQLPKKVRAVFDPLEPAFRRPTHRRLVLLALAAILTLGGRTVANLLRVLEWLAPGDPTSYHRVFSRNRWSFTSLVRRYVAAVLTRFAPSGPILLAADDTVTEHPGPHVYGKGRHRDPVRSTHSYTAFRWGHKWVVLTLLVAVPWATRQLACPFGGGSIVPRRRVKSSSNDTKRRLNCWRRCFAF